MKNLSARGLLPVEDMNDLFEGRLRVNLPGGSFKVVSRTYPSARGSQVYDRQLHVSTVIYLQPEGHVLPLNPVTARTQSQGKANQVN